MGLGQHHEADDQQGGRTEEGAAHAEPPDQQSGQEAAQPAGQAEHGVAESSLSPAPVQLPHHRREDDAERAEGPGVDQEEQQAERYEGGPGMDAEGVQDGDPPKGPNGQA